MVVVVCHQCGVPFEVFPCRANTAKYCSTECKYQARALSIDERFHERVASPDENGCMLWTHSTDSKGYGRLWYEGGRIGAHRLAWEIHHGIPVPEGMQVNHHCDNPLCCNPAHLYVGSQADNMQDMADRDRSLKGEKHPNTNLTARQVAMIRYRYAEGGISHQQLADAYHIGRSTVGQLIRGDRWNCA